MALQGLNCVWCGAPLQKEGEGYFCKHCGRAYKDDGIEQAYRRLVEGIEAQFGSAISDAQRKEKEERFYALRANLWEKSHASNVDSRAILEICREIKGIHPYDFVACFFEVANGPSVKELVEFLDKTDVKENAVYIDSVLDFLLRSLSQELIFCLLRLR